MKFSRFSPAVYADGILSGDRVMLGRAITLIESRLKEDQELAQEVLQRIMPHTGNAFRIGITGVPGVGKSSFIEVFATALAEEGKKIAVLAIDPSSPKTKGSIMGDKTRMEQLASHPNAFVRPSPAGETLGGVARKTRETMLLCEAAGFEIIIVETVGVGQSETAVQSMTDFFLLLMLAGAGDELQGIKKGIMEMADLVVITKVDGENVAQAQRAKQEYTTALHLFRTEKPDWSPSVLTCSAVTKEGFEEVWQLISTYRQKMTENGWLHHQRTIQNLEWMHSSIKEFLLDEFYQHPKMSCVLQAMEKEVREQQTPPLLAAKKLWETFKTVR